MRLPDELLNSSFTLGQARAAGIGRRELRTSRWRHLQYNRYQWAGVALDEEHLPLAILLESLPPGSAIAGFNAARLFGLDVSLPRRPEVIVPPDAGITVRARATVRRVILEPQDVTLARGLPVTTPLRTCFDLAGRLSPVEAVVVADLALHRELFDLTAWESYIVSHAGRKGVAGSRRTLEHVEPRAESAMETRLRMLLVGDGLPRPQAQVDLFDRHGAFVGRADLYYPDPRLAIEYDGENHRDRLVSDNRRQNRFEAAGIRLLRYTWPDLTDRPHAIAAEVRAALARPPLPLTPDGHL